MSSASSLKRMSMSQSVKNFLRREGSSKGSSTTSVKETPSDATIHQQDLLLPQSNPDTDGNGKPEFDLTFESQSSEIDKLDSDFPPHAEIHEVFLGNNLLDQIPADSFQDILTEVRKDAEKSQTTSPSSSLQAKKPLNLSLCISPQPLSVSASGVIHAPSPLSAAAMVTRGENAFQTTSPSVSARRSPERKVPIAVTGHLHGPGKHVKTEVLVSRHMFKAKFSKYQSYLDRASTLINVGTDEAIVEGEIMIAKVMTKAWLSPKIGHELAYSLCDYLRETGSFETMIQYFIHPESSDAVRIAAGKALEESMAARNRAAILNGGYVEAIIIQGESFANRMQRNEIFAQDALRVSISLMESLFKLSPEVSMKIIELNALDHILNAIKVGTFGVVHKHAALALANLSMYSDNECQQKMIAKKVQDWLFLLASLQDDITRYYACLAICMLVSNKEIEKEVIKSGTLSLVEPFLIAHRPEQFAASDYRHSQGRNKEWLQKLVPMLNAKRREARSLAAYHFAMEASIKKEQENMEIFQDIRAVEALKQVASSPDEVPAKFARMALKIIGEEVPYKLSHQVPLWSIEDVHYWVSKIGFKEYAKKFEEQMVDGDLLLLLTDEELERDIGMVSGLLRKRFQRELDSLKVAADYSCIDETQMDRVLMSINAELSIYTYRLLELGFDTTTLPMANDELLKDVVGIKNPVHRSKILHISQECSHIEDMEMEILKKHIDVFISYRRSTGNQLASLIKVLLQLRGHKVFIDVDRLNAGKFDSSLLKNIQAADHFILVLTPGAMDRCLDDNSCDDWVHKEISCAINNNRNIIPIFDPEFQWPEESKIPPDIRAVTRFNGVRWVHEYQEACVDKLERFINGELRTGPPTSALPNQAPVWPPHRPISPPQSQHVRRHKPSLPVHIESPTNGSRVTSPVALDGLHRSRTTSLSEQHLGHLPN